MTRSEIDFVHHRWPLGLVAMVAAVVVSVLLAAWMYWGHHNQVTLLEAEALRIQKLATNANVAPAVTPKVPPSWLSEAEASLGQDWNVLFSHLETTTVEGVRLLSVQATMHPAAYRVEFELDGWLRVSELNEALNETPERGRWNLQSVSPATGGNVAAGPVRAVWTR